LDRFVQIMPKFVFVETEVVYAGKAVNVMEKVVEVVNELASKDLSMAVFLPSAVTGRYPLELPKKR
jgi:acetoacetyl-CoA synthetase